MTTKVSPSILHPQTLDVIRDSNRIINGDFSVNQRAFAGGALGIGVYGHDRWKGGAAGVIQCTNFTMLDLSPIKCRFSATVAAGLTAGQGSIFRAGNAAARLYFEAEL